MAITIVGEVEGGVGAESTYPPCPDCGATGIFLKQEADIVNGCFTLIDVYACPKCHPELLPR